MPEQSQIPRVLWAQQREHVLLTVAVPDIEKVNVKFEEDSVAFQGHSASSNGKNKNVYEVRIDLYEKIDPETSKYENIGQKFWRLLLKKKDSNGAFWPRLTKDKARLHWLQTDFDHWKDEDESDDEKAGPGGFGGNFQDMFSGGMGGLEGMGGMPGMPGMDMDGGSDDEEGDSDDDESPMAAENNQESKTSTDQPATTTTTTEQTTTS